MGIEIALMSILALGGAGVYLGLKTLENYSPGRRKVQKDLALLKKEIAPLVADLVPLGKEEMTQISFNASNKTSKKGVVKTSKGVFTTVYHEPLVAWVYRKYISAKENALIYAKTTRFEFVYRTKKGETEVVVNGHPIGTIDESGALRPRKSKAPGARLDRSKNGAYFPVTINGKEVGGLTNLAATDQPNPRAFQLMAVMGEEEELLFLVLAIHEMVRVSI